MQNPFLDSRGRENPFLAALLMAAVFPSTAHGQQVCLPRPAVIAQLAHGYGETVTARGLTNAGTVLELLTGDRTWSIIVTLPDGTSCLIAAGWGWETVPVVKGQGA